MKDNSNKTLLVSGCSRTFGYNLKCSVFYELSHPGNIPSPNAWPAVYAKLAGYKTVNNIAAPGASNHYIVRSIINKATELLDSNNAFDIAVMWTNSNRFEYYKKCGTFSYWTHHTAWEPYIMSKYFMRYVSDQHWEKESDLSAIMLAEFTQRMNINFYQCQSATKQQQRIIFNIEHNALPCRHPNEDGHQHAAHVLYNMWHNKTGE